MVPAQIQWRHGILSPVDVERVVPPGINLKIKVLICGCTLKTEDTSPGVKYRCVRLNPASDRSNRVTFYAGNANIYVVIHTVEVQRLTSIKQRAFSPRDLRH